jgi:hypothetical protein
MNERKKTRRSKNELKNNDLSFSLVVARRENQKARTRFVSSLLPAA